MGNSPKVLVPGEKWRVEESEYYPRGLEALIKGKIPSQKIMECESRYLLTELKDMAEARGLSPAGGKELLCRQLIRAGVVS